MGTHKKYFTLSYDDGLEQDKQIIRLLKKYGIQATFNLNSGLLGQKECMKYIGTMGFEAAPYPAKCGRMVKAAPNHRIPADEIRQVYEGFELATHTVHHVRLPVLPESELEKELVEDRERLQRFTDLPVVGHAFPFGASSPKTEAVLKKNGFLYARTVKRTQGRGSKRFAFPDDLLRLNPTCWHIDKDVEALLDEFLSLPVQNDDMLFYMWGHGYELDFDSMRKRNFMKTFERMLDKVSNDSTVVKCSNSDAFRLHSADSK